MEHDISPHPGRLVQQQLDRLGLSAAELAANMQVPLASVEDILAERHPVTPDLALRLGKSFGSGGQWWMAMQAFHDIDVARSRSGFDAGAIPCLLPRADVPAPTDEARRKLEGRRGSV